MTKEKEEPKKNRFVTEHLPIIRPGQEPNRCELKEQDILTQCEHLLQQAATVRQTVIPPVFETHERSSILSNLIAQVVNAEREDAIRAVYTLEQLGWLADGSLRGVALAGARLSGVVLMEADLTGADLTAVDLSNAYLSHVNLSGAKLVRANLSNAVVVRINLREAILQEANLQQTWLENPPGLEILRSMVEGTTFEGADLQGAFLVGNWKYASFKRANLLRSWFKTTDIDGVDFTDANLLEMVNEVVKYGKNTVMPDGRPPFSNDNEPRRFSQADRSDFWTPQWLKNQDQNSDN